MGTSVAEQRSLDTILKELKTLQDEYRGKPMPQNVGEKFEALAAEAKAHQDAADRERLIRNFEKFSKEVPEPVLPATEGKRSQNGNGNGAAADPDAVIGYIGLGEAFVNSPEWKAYQAAGKPQAGSAAFVADGMSVRSKAMPVTRRQIDTNPALKSAIGRAEMEQKAVVTVGAGVLRADRQADVVRFAEQDRLTVRDLLRVRPTNSSSVDWVTISSWTGAAIETAESAAKPEAAGAFSTGTAPVRTIAVWIPVTEQQLDDVPQIEAIIDDELRYDIRKREDQQLLWGDGVGQNLLGIFNTTGVGVGRTVGGDTFVDQIRRMMTDVATAGLDPNGLVIHPLDWETIALVKGTDGHYLYQVFPDSTGAMRVWGLTPVETVAARKPTLAVNTNTVYERRMLVGDFRRAATLWDRRQLNVSVGWINDQFVRNQRTIRAEERVAFAVQQAAGFKYRITQAEAA